MNSNENLREAINEVSLTGIVQEINLEERKGKDCPFISGTVTIKTDENSMHVVSCYANKKKIDGGLNSAFEGLATVMNEYISVASLLASGKTEAEANAGADKVSVNRATLNLNEYYSNSNLISKPQIKANYFHRLTSTETYKPKAEFNMECYFHKIKPEIKNDEETGRVIVEAIVPIFGGKVLPFELVAEEGEVADYILNTYEVKRTGWICGELVNTVVSKVTKRGGFGKTMVKETNTRINELRITGGDEYQYDDDSPKAFARSAIKKAMSIRETETLPALQKKYEEKKGNNKRDNKKGFGLNDKQQAALEAFNTDDFDEDEF